MNLHLSNFESNLFMKYSKHIPFIILILILVVAGLRNYSTYGTQWDEYLQREMGRFNYNQITGQNDSLKVWRGRDYGIVVELPLYVLEKKFAPDKPAQSIFIRHLACYFLYCFGVFVFYLTLLRLKFKPIWAFCGVLMLVISPRIYGHAFINSKDVPLMVFYIFSYFSLLLYLENPNFKRSIFHALTCALLIDTRITGVIIVPLTLLFFVLYEFQKRDKKISQIVNFELLKQLKVYLFSLIVFVYVFWPFLWPNPIKNFLVAFLNMSHYRWKGYSLLFGDFIYSYETPWYFAIAWIGITTPLLYLLLFFSGSFSIILYGFKQKMQAFKNQEFLEKIMPICLLSAPLVAIIALKSVLYDTWRHIYFVYPFLIIVALNGALIIMNQIQIKPIKWALTAAFFAYINIEMIKMIQSFPNEYVYFNELVSDSPNNIRKNYDMDYWGTSFRQGLEKILEVDQRDTIKITGNVYPCYSNYVLLKHLDPKCRLQYVLEEKDADYYLTTYRYKPNDHQNFEANKIFNIKYKNSEILGVYKVK